MSTGTRAQALQLFVLRDGDLVASEMFGEGTYLLGNAPDSDVFLDHPSVAAIELEFRDGKVRLSGSGGFHLNGVRVAEAELSSADDVWLGPFLLKTRLMGRRRISTPPGSSGKSHRTGGAALALVPQPPPPPAMEFDPAEVEQLLSTPLQSAPEPFALDELDDAEAAQLLTPIAEPTPAPAPPLQQQLDALPAAHSEVAPAHEPTTDPIFPDGTPDELHAAPEAAPAARVEPPAPLPRAEIPKSPPAPAPIAEAPKPPPARAAEAPPSPPPARRPLATPPPPPRDEAPATPPAPSPRAEPSPPSPARTPSAPGLQPAARATSQPGSKPLAPESKPSQPETKPERPASAPSMRPASSPSMRPASSPSMRPASSPSMRPASAPGLRPASAARPASVARSSRGLVHARVFWGETLLFSSSAFSKETTKSSAADSAALQLYGFVPRGGPLLRAADGAFRVAVPPGAQAFQRTHGGWTAAEPSPSGELVLPLGGLVRLSNNRFRLELSAQAPPKRAGARANSDLDLRLSSLLLLLGASLVILIHSLPKVLPVQPLEPEVYRHVQMTMKEEKPKPKPKRTEPPPKPVVLLAEVTSLKQVNVPLHSLDKIAKATKGLSNLLASLTAAPTKKNATALPPIDRGPAPLPSLGGTGTSGPITKGSELLRGSLAGLLNQATGGTGAVRGVPVSVPKRPSRVQGSIDRDAVAAVINEKVGEMRACYERALLRDPNLGAGKVLLEWTIDPAGNVGEVRTKTATLKSAEVVSCLLDLLRGLKFPKPNGGVVIVTYPVLFNSVGY